MTSLDLQATVLELLASRMCHDLISPVGAVNNGVEFVQETGMADGAEAIDLIAYSAAQAAARLQAFRMAYGAGGRDPNIKPDEIHRIFGELLGKDGRIRQDWDAYQDFGFDERPPGFCKVLLGTLMLASETLPKGGVIGVAADGQGETVVTATGQDAAPRPHMPEALNRTISAGDLDPRLIHAYALALIAAQYGFTVTFGTPVDQKVALSIRQAT